MQKRHVTITLLMWQECICKRAAVKKSRPQSPKRKEEKAAAAAAMKRKIETAAFEIAKGEREPGREVLLGCEMQLGEAEGLAGR